MHPLEKRRLVTAHVESGPSLKPEAAVRMRRRTKSHAIGVLGVSRATGLVWECGSIWNLVGKMIPREASSIEAVDSYKSMMDDNDRRAIRGPALSVVPNLSLRAHS